MFCDLLGQGKQADMARTSLKPSRDMYPNHNCPGLSNEDHNGVRYLTEPRLLEGSRTEMVRAEGLECRWMSMFVAKQYI